MPQLTRDELTRVIRDTLYATVGVGVLTVQQLDQARRQVGAEACKAATEAGAKLTSFVRDAAA
jgi:hypothetical protein